MHSVLSAVRTILRTCATLLRGLRAAYEYQCVSGLLQIRVAALVVKKARRTPYYASLCWDWRREEGEGPAGWREPVDKNKSNKSRVSPSRCSIRSTAYYSYAVLASSRTTEYLLSKSSYTIPMNGNERASTLLITARPKTCRNPVYSPQLLFAGSS